MEELIPFFIFLLIWIVSLVLKLGPKKKSAGSAGQTKSRGIIANLNDFFTKIQKQIEAQQKAEQGPADASQWRRLMEEGSVPKKEPAPLPDLVFDPDESDILPQPEPSELPHRERVQRLRKTASPPDLKQQTVPARRELHKGRSGIHMGRRKLRRAVVWSEILGPPVALKDRREDRW